MRGAGGCCRRFENIHGFTFADPLSPGTKKSLKTRKLKTRADFEAAVAIDDNEGGAGHAV